MQLRLNKICCMTKWLTKLLCQNRCTTILKKENAVELRNYEISGEFKHKI